MNVFSNRNFFLLWQGQLISQLGSQAFIVSASYLTLSRTGSASLMALVLTASTLPLVVVSPIGGAVADRHSRRAILVITDLIRGLVMAIVGLVILIRPDATTLHISMLAAGGAINGVLAGLFGPALHALIPDVVSRQQLPSANALTQITNQVAVMIGQASSGILYVVLGPALLLIANGVSFAYAALSTSLTPTDAVPPQPRLRLAETVNEYAKRIREGLAYLRQQRGMTTLLVAFAVVNLAFMPIFVLLPFYVSDTLRRGPDWYGFLLAGSGAGALVGSSGAARILRTVGRTDVVLPTCLGGLAIAVLVLALTSRELVAAAAFVAVGIQSSIINVIVVTTVQARSLPQFRGRVMALVMALSSAAVPVGMIAGGVIGDAWRDALDLAFSVCASVIGVVAVILARHRLNSADDPGQRHAREGHASLRIS